MIGQRVRARGFTLVEVLVAVGLLGMMGVLIGTSTSSLIGAIRDTRKTQEYFHTARVALSRIEKELSMAYLSKHQSELRSTKTVFVGKPSGVVFTTIGHRRMVRGARESDEAVIEYKVEKDSKSGDNVLVRREKPLIDDSPFKGGRKQVLARGVKKITFAYWDMDKETWQSDWKVEIDNVQEAEMKKAATAAGVAAATGNTALGKAVAGLNQEATHGPEDLWLPARVRVTLVLQTEDGDQAFETQTRVRLMQPLDLGGVTMPKAFENTFNPYAAMPAQTPGSFSVPGAAGGAALRAGGR
jgi:general secretion pathway protein J